MKISVVLAAYHGEKYIGEQLASILPQLGSGDELIVSDDAPNGAVLEVVCDFLPDSRIRYIEGAGEGVVKNFENALHAASGEVIFFADQDDVWLDGKVKRVLREFENGADVVLHDAKVTDICLSVTQPSFFKLHGSHRGVLRNIVRNSYVGCCMAMTARMKDIVLPFPEGLPMHDQWIGILGELYGKTVFVNEPLMLYRRHSESVTGAKTSVAQKLKWRAVLIKALISKKAK